MEKNKFASNASGGIVFLTNVEDHDSFKGNWWVEFAQSGREHDAYMVDHFDGKSDAQSKAKEVADLML